MDKIKKWMMDNTNNTVTGASLGLMFISAFMHSGFWAAVFIGALITALLVNDD